MPSANRLFWLVNSYCVQKHLNLQLEMLDTIPDLPPTTCIVVVISSISDIVVSPESTSNPSVVDLTVDDVIFGVSALTVLVVCSEVVSVFVVEAVVVDVGEIVVVVGRVVDDCVVSIGMVDVVSIAIVDIFPEVVVDD